MPPRGRGRSGSRTGGGRSGSGSGGPSDSKQPAALRRIVRQRQQSSVKGISESKSKESESEGASQNVPRSVSPSSSSSSLPTEVDSDSSSDSGYDTCARLEYPTDSDSDSGYDSDRRRRVFQLDEEGQKIQAIANKLPCRGLMLLLFETPSGFALFTFNGVYCHMPGGHVDYLWAEFRSPNRAAVMAYPKGFVSFEDKSSAISADTGVDKRLVDLINKWHHPGMILCVGKSEYKKIIESVLKISCMCCQTVMEMMWGIQQHMRTFVPAEKSKLKKEDRLPTSQGLLNFLTNCGFDVKPEMVNEKIFVTAAALFWCDIDDENNLGLLRDAGLNIRDISGIACEDWDILKLAVAVKVICCPKEELSDFHEVLEEDVVSKLKGDARKYKYIPVKVLWLSTYDKVVSNYHLRIAKKKMLGSLVRKAKKAYEAEQMNVCEKVKLHGGLEQIAQDHVTSVSNLSTSLVGDPTTTLVGEVVRRSPRLNPKLYENSGEYKHAWLEGTPLKRPKYCTGGTSMAMDEKKCWPAYHLARSVHHESP